MLFNLFSFLKFYSKKILSDTVNSTVENPFLMIPYAPDFNENLSQCVPFFFFFHFNKLVFFTDSESQKDKDIFFKDTYLVATGLSCSTWKLLLWHVGSSSLTRNQTQASPTLETHSFSHWATRQVLEPLL